MYNKVRALDIFRYILLLLLINGGINDSVYQGSLYCHATIDQNDTLDLASGEECQE